jgi:sugar transferase (PEP-CTERM/EpsH1 system associated)
MANLLFLTHRLPYPPDKGDKIHTYHLLRHLAQKHRVLLGTFVDDPQDEQHVSAVQNLCADLHVARLRPAQARWRALGSLWRREPATVACYRDAGMARWVRGISERRGADVVLVHSSAMLQYAQQLPDAPLVVDFNDVDSAKWVDYAGRRTWPMSQVYRREGRRLLETERRGATHARWSLFATEREAQLFRTLAPESAARVAVLGNGVDAAHFSPQVGAASPYQADEQALVFVGTMNYWPNVDAVIWFARDVLPALRQRWPTARLYIVGRSPSAAVRELHGEAVRVIGTVPDTRPWLQHAAVVVAPMRVARGIQNKVLEAMAMARPVVASAACADAIDAEAGRHLWVCASAEDFVQHIQALLADPVLAQATGSAGRDRVRSAYAWRDRMRWLDGFLADTAVEPAV